MNLATALVVVAAITAMTVITITALRHSEGRYRHVLEELEAVRAWIRGDGAP